MKTKQFYGEPDQFILKADNRISHLLNNILKRFRKISFFYWINSIFDFYIILYQFYLMIQPEEVEFTIATTLQDLGGIVELSQKNLMANLSA